MDGIQLQHIMYIHLLEYDVYTVFQIRVGYLHVISNLV